VAAEFAEHNINGTIEKELAGIRPVAATISI